MNASLAFDVVAGASASGPTALFLHGILGSRSNWKGFARRLLERHPSWRCLLVDLRGHGDSHGLPPPHTVEACADDVIALCDRLSLQVQLAVGHSFGGKVAIAFAERARELSELWVLDAPPGPRPGLAADEDGSREEVARVLSVVRALPLPIPSRKELVSQLTSRGLSAPIAQWMTTNLAPVEGGFSWRFDLDVIEPLLRSFGALDCWPALEERVTARVHLVRGGRSDRFTPDELSRVRRAVDAGLLEESVLQAAGHWVHTDDPDGLLALLSPALKRRAP